MLTWHKLLERKLKLYKLLCENSAHFNSRFTPDPLSQLIINNAPRYHKLEIFFLASTLLRFSDCKKMIVKDFLSDKSQSLLQGKTKNEIVVPSLFLSTHPDSITSFPAVNLFCDSYDKIRYSLKLCTPDWIISQIKTERIVTHIFRFLRASHMYIQHNDFYLSSKYLGHKDPESVRSYVPPELLNLYSNYLLKG